MLADDVRLSPARSQQKVMFGQNVGHDPKLIDEIIVVVAICAGSYVVRAMAWMSRDLQTSIDDPVTFSEMPPKHTQIRQAYIEFPYPRIFKLSR